jgi:hypothetical protein
MQKFKKTRQTVACISQNFQPLLGVLVKYLLQFHEVFEFLLKSFFNPIWTGIFLRQSWTGAQCDKQ